MVTWNAETNTKLFLAIMRQCDVKPDNEKLAAELTQALGEVVTVSSIQNQLKKLKKQVKESANDAVSAKDSPKFPAKAKALTEKKGTTKNGKGAKKNTQQMLNDDDDDDEEEQRPSKKVKKEEDSGWIFD